SRAVRLERGFELLELRLRNGLRAQQFARPVVLAFTFVDGRLCRGDVGACRRVVELHEYLALADTFAVAEVDRGDDVRRLGTDVDRLVGVRGAERLELLGDEFAADRDGGDERGSGAPGSAGGGNARACAGLPVLRGID